MENARITLIKYFKYNLNNVDKYYILYYDFSEHYIWVRNTEHGLYH